jgi:hypothetical protein
MTARRTIAALSLVALCALCRVPSMQAASRSAGDRLQAELSARAGLAAARLVLAAEPDLRAAVDADLLLTARPSPQLDVTTLVPAAVRAALPAELAAELQVVPSNALVLVSQPLFFTGDQARREQAMRLYALMGGYQPASEHDELFAAPRPDRLTLISAIIDYWDGDEERTRFDPGAGTVSSEGSEGSAPKNAALDSLDELRLVEGISPEHWERLVQPDPDDLGARRLTIYGSGVLDANLAPPEPLLARACSVAPEEPLCTDPLQSAAFLELLRTARSLFPGALFSSPQELSDLLAGRGE